MDSSSAGEAAGVPAGVWLSITFTIVFLPPAFKIGFWRPIPSHALFHFDDAVGDQAVRLAMDGNRRVLVRRLDQAEHLPRRLVEPIAQVLHVVFLLRLQIGL